MGSSHSTAALESIYGLLRIGHGSAGVYTIAFFIVAVVDDAITFAQRYVCSSRLRRYPQWRLP